MSRDLSSQLQDSDPTAVETPRAKKRRRVPKACEPCRRRKVKCDGSFPCDLCVGYGYNCVYAHRESFAEEPDLVKPKLSPPALSRLQPKLPKSPRLPPMVNEEARKQLYEFSHERQDSQTGNPGFTRADSALAFPRSIGLSLHARNLPKLQACAWNTGTRIETPEPNQPDIFAFLDIHDVEVYSKIYFNCVYPIFGLLDQNEFTLQASCSWATQTIDPGFQAVVCGVVALGSLFSGNNSFVHEAEIIEQARLTLDGSFAQSIPLLSVEFVVGWILRAIYLRSTSMPHVTWMASSMAMHIAESIGLHQEISEIKPIKNPQGQVRIFSEKEIETRRRIFWVASLLNRFSSVQYGRTMTVLQNVTCRYPKTLPEDGNMDDDFVGLLRLLPPLCDASKWPEAATITVLTDGLLELGRKELKKRPLLLIRAEAMFCIYRKLKYIGIVLSPAQTDVILSAIRAALDAANALALDLQQWWTITGIPFHSICILVSLNTFESLDLLPKAMETLQNVSAIFNTHRTREALCTAQYLVKVAEAWKRKELECLQRSLNLNTTLSSVLSPGVEDNNGTGVLQSFEWPTDADLGFSYFFDDSLTIQDPSITVGMF